MRLARKRWQMIGVFAAAAVLLWCFLVSKYALEVTNYTLTTPKLTAPIRIVHLTDLHNSEFGEGNARLAEMVKKQRPDLILLTGDMLNGDDPETGIAESLIRKLADIAPVYAAQGNHEKANRKVYGTNIAACYEQAGAVWLEQTYEDITVNGQMIRLGGIMGYCLSEKYLKTGEARHHEIRYLKALQDTDLFSILLCHYPLCWIVNDNLEEWDVDCIFSGHIHGGQVRLPVIGGLYAPDHGWFPGQLRGLYRSQDRERVLVVSRGLGSRGKIPRFNNVPEIVVVDILPQMK